MKQNALTAVVFAVLIFFFAATAADWRLPWAAKPEHGADWCVEHDVAESECVICRPEIARGGTVVVRDTGPATEGHCPNTCVRITLAPGVAARAGVRLDKIEKHQIAEVIKANAETQFVPSKYARVAPRIPGIVRQVKGTLGLDVEAGQTLAVLESPDFGSAKSDWLAARSVLDLRQKTFDREQSLFDQKVSPERDLLEAKTVLEEARLALARAAQRLEAYGVTAEQLAEIAEKKDASARMEVASPFKGRIVEASAVPGESASPDRPIFAVADMTRLWISIDVTEGDLARVEKGQFVIFSVEGLVGQRFPAEVVAIGGAVDDRTRTVSVLAEVKNVKGLLRSRMFGRAEIQVRPPQPKLLVPKDAVQNDGDCLLVFVSPSQDTFQARKIEVGAVYDNGFELIGGIAEGESVVTTGSFLLKTEVLRGEMGAG